MATETSYVIVGASLAGAKAAEILRAESFGGRIVMIGAEHERPYERPPLSKELAGMNVNDKIAALVRAGRPVETARLANPDIPPEALVGD